MFKRFVDFRLKKAVKPFLLRQMSCVSKDLEPHRFADYHRAVQAFVDARTQADKFSSQHYNLPLCDIVQGKFNQHNSRVVTSSPVRLIDVGYEKSEPFADEQFWAFKSDEENLAGVIRLRTAHEVAIEIALNDSSKLTTIVEEIDRLSVEHSVYRNQLLSIEFESPMRDGYGYSQHSNGLDISFLRHPDIKDDDIIFDPNVKKVLQRNVVSFLQNRDQLESLGLPLQRGVLLYGPPGTGKTFTCQYLYNKLHHVTMIRVSGKGLGQVHSICAFARMMQPSVLVLEDVDLIFASREINLYSSALGEMMDELDAFKSNDNVLFILTTNAIDRLEEAIKDRPGRVAQCVYLGPPNLELRRRYLKRYLKPYDCSDLSVEAIAQKTDGASQAFLEELVYRSVQIASETGGTTPKLQNRHFDEAMEEMTMHKSQSTGNIVGFKFGA